MFNTKSFNLFSNQGPLNWHKLDHSHHSDKQIAFRVWEQYAYETHNQNVYNLSLFDLLMEL